MNLQLSKLILGQNYKLKLVISLNCNGKIPEQLEIQPQELVLIFTKHSRKEGVTRLLVYVDGIIMTGNDEKGKEELKQRLFQEFELKELGRLKYLLGIEVSYSNQGIFIS